MIYLFSHLAAETGLQIFIAPEVFWRVFKTITARGKTFGTVKIVRVFLNDH